MGSGVKRNHTRHDSNYPINLRHVDAVRILVVNCSYVSLISLRMEKLWFLGESFPKRL